MPALLQPSSVALSASGRKSLQHVFERMDKVNPRHDKFVGCKRFKTTSHCRGKRAGSAMPTSRNTQAALEYRPSQRWSSSPSLETSLKLR